jgi:hypothetical protein
MVVGTGKSEHCSEQTAPLPLCPSPSLYRTRGPPRSAGGTCLHIILGSHVSPTARVFDTAGSYDQPTLQDDSHFCEDTPSHIFVSVINGYTKVTSATAVNPNVCALQAHCGAGYLTKDINVGP